VRAGLIAFLGANLFLFGMAAAGAAVAVLLFKSAQFAGAEGDLLHWLTLPIALAAISGSYVSGKLAHRLLVRLI
jgi:hypothetical protein